MRPKTLSEKLRAAEDLIWRLRASIKALEEDINDLQTDLDDTVDLSNVLLEGLETMLTSDICPKKVLSCYNLRHDELKAGHELETIVKENS